MDMVAAKDNPVSCSDLHPTGFPSMRESARVVRPDPIALDHDVAAVPGNTDLTIMVHIAAADLAARSDSDPPRAVQPCFAILHNPRPGALGLDRPLLRDTG